MAAFELIVTDVTCYGALYCVAGWDRLSGRMVRPEPSTADPRNEASRFWGNDFAGPGKAFCIGNIVQFDASQAPSTFPFPHATEDRVVSDQGKIREVGKLSTPEIAQQVAASVSPTLEAAFDNGLIRQSSRKAYVPEGYKGRSLGALDVAPGDLSFFENQFQNKPKLRARVTVNSVVYDLSVTAHAARERWKSAGLVMLRSDVSNANLLHVRVGLARPFPNNECYSQINGVLIL